MAEQSTIEWTNATVNFWWGCTKVGPGCTNCYAESLAHRFGDNVWGVGAPRKKIKGAVALIHRLDNSYADWSADYHCGLLGKHDGPRRRVFISSMADLFDLEVPAEWFAEAWKHIIDCDRIDIQIVTKRVSAVEKRLAAIGATSWPKHAGLIITVVNQAEADRDIPRLLALKAKFDIPWVGLSMEPLLGPVNIAWALSRNRLDVASGILERGMFSPGLETLSRVDWVIVGGESGHQARPMHPDWARSLRDQCAEAHVPLLFKQWGHWREPIAGEEYDTGKGRLANPPAFLVSQDGTVHCFTEQAGDNPSVMLGVGKKRAGRLLDGAEHNGFPEVRHV